MNWAKLNTYLVGDVTVVAPQAVVKFYNLVPDQSDLKSASSVKSVRWVELNIPHYHDTDFNTSHSSICESMSNTWAKELCSDPPKYVKDLPESFRLFNLVYKDMLDGSRTANKETVFEHFSDMNFEYGPLQISCDRKNVENTSSKRTCTSVLVLSVDVAAIWSHSFAETPFIESGGTLSQACREGEAIHKWFIEGLREIPTYGVDPPSCPEQLSRRS